MNKIAPVAQRLALTAGGMGVDSGWEQEKLEAMRTRNACHRSESHPSGACFVRRVLSPESLWRKSDINNLSEFG